MPGVGIRGMTGPYVARLEEHAVLAWLALAVTSRLYRVPGTSPVRKAAAVKGGSWAQCR
jgi:hypothetical protein